MIPLDEASALLLDTGPLIALVNRRDQHHAWARRLLGRYDGRLVTCEAVISKAWFLAQSRLDPLEALLALLDRLPLDIEPAWGPRALALVRRYADLPMDAADACIVALAEREARRLVVTTDVRDFTIYRMHRQQRVPTVTP